MTTVQEELPVGALLRGWRNRARLSQLELALRADSSARHISFIETGRSRPSPEMVLRLADQLEVPVRERNTLLVSAGYAPRYAETPLSDPSMAAVREGLERMVAAYEPYPALVVDGTYQVLAANRGVSLLMDGVAPHLLEPPLNSMRVTLHPEGLAPRILNFQEWRGHLVEQMERQLAPARSAPLRALYEEVTAYPPPDQRAGTGTGTGEGPGPEGDAGSGQQVPFALRLVIEHRGQVLTFLSTIATFNTPLDVTVSELAVETLLPADAQTARRMWELLP